MAQWIGSRDWSIWITGTFRPAQKLTDTINTKNRFINFVELLSKNYDRHNIEYFLAVERFKTGYFTHVHAVLGGVDGIPYRDIGTDWRSLYGREQVERYQKNKGADYYLTKYITKELCDWDFHMNKKILKLK